MKELYPWVCITDTNSTKRKTTTDNESIDTSADTVTIAEKPAKA